LAECPGDEAISLPGGKGRSDWGESAEEVEKGGNVAAIHDGHDEPTFEYKGESYRMDRVLLR
jgi:hypothetical protein